MKSCVIGVLLFAGLTGQAFAQAGVTAGGEIFCMTKKDHGELLSAAAVSDQTTIDVLLKAQRCGVMRAGVEYRITNFNVFTSSEIRVFYSGGLMDVWGSGDLWIKAAKNAALEKGNLVAGKAQKNGM